MTMALPCDASRSVATCAGTAHPAALERPAVDQVAANAANVILDGPSGVVLGYRSSSHLGHALMTLLTGRPVGCRLAGLSTEQARGSDPPRMSPVPMSERDGRFATGCYMSR